MKLITKALIKKLPKFYSTEKLDESKKKAIIKYFSPVGRFTWYVIEGEVHEDGDILFFGYVKGNDPMDDEYGYFSLKELESITLPWGLKIERDLHFKDVPLIDILEGRNY